MDEFDGLGGSLLAAAEDVLEAVLQEVDAAALSRLKAVSVGGAPTRAVSCATGCGSGCAAARGSLSPQAWTASPTWTWSA